MCGQEPNVTAPPCRLNTDQHRGYHDEKLAPACSAAMFEELRQLHPEQRLLLREPTPGSVGEKALASSLRSAAALLIN